MKWRTHAELSRCVAEVIGLPDELGQLFVQATLDPDRNALRMTRTSGGRTERVRIRHHDPPRSELVRQIWRSRNAWLEGREEDAIWSLGRTLHYVQDMHVRTGVMMLSHDPTEEGISRLEVDRRVAVLGASTAVTSPHFVEECLRRAGPREDIRQALDSATLLSSAIAVATLGARSPPPSCLAKWREDRRRHRALVIPLAAIAPALVVVWAFAAGVPYYSILGIPAFLAVMTGDSRYRYDREEAQWFGLTI
ncbi:MAG TPA: hypothetical protein VMS79_01880 [Methanomassiliicoccales archaeon]|nr:hypothetical protein [Methanomassiliicoccales archaeon]